MLKTQFLFIYIVYILAFISAVLMLFLSVVLMLPISTLTSKNSFTDKKERTYLISAVFTQFSNYEINFSIIIYGLVTIYVLIKMLVYINNTEVKSIVQNINPFFFILEFNDFAYATCLDSMSSLQRNRFILLCNQMLKKLKLPFFYIFVSHSFKNGGKEKIIASYLSDTIILNPLYRLVRA
jgi:hypothetical protein